MIKTTRLSRNQMFFLVAMVVLMVVTFFNIKGTEYQVSCTNGMVKEYGWPMPIMVKSDHKQRFTAIQHRIATINVPNYNSTSVYKEYWKIEDVDELIKLLSLVAKEYKKEHDINKNWAISLAVNTLIALTMLIALNYILYLVHVKSGWCSAAAQEPVNADFPPKSTGNEGLHEVQRRDEGK